MIIDFLISKDGLRIDHVDLRISGIRLTKKGSGLAPEVADLVEGSVRLTLSDLAATFARPEILDQLLAGVAGIARPEITLADADDGGIRITGSIELMGRRFPVTVFSRLSIEKNRVILSAGQLEGLPMLGALSSRLPSVALPLTLPPGLQFTTVTTKDGAVVVSFEGHDVSIGPDSPMPNVDPAATPVDSAEPNRTLRVVEDDEREE